MTWADFLEYALTGGALGIFGTAGWKLVDLFFMRKPKQKTDTESIWRQELREEINGLRARVDTLEEALEETEKERDFLYRKHEIYKIEIHRLLAIDYSGLTVDGILIQRVLDLDKRIVDDNL